MSWKFVSLRVLVGILVLNCSLLAAEKFDILSYNKALEFYKNLDYENSYIEFKKLNQIYLDNLDVNYYLGRSAFNLKKYEEAVSAYDRILIQIPTNLRARLELARSYFYLGNLDDAKEEFKTILSYELSPEAKDNVLKFIVKIEEAKKRNLLSGALIAGVVYDSNLYNSPDRLKGDTTTDDADWAHQEVLALTHTYDFGKSDLYTLKNNFLFLNKTYFDYSDKNLVYISYAPAISWQRKQFGFDVNFGYSRMWYGSDKYMQTFGFSPSMTYDFDKLLQINASLKYQKKLYLQSANSNNDSYFSEAKLGVVSKKIESFVLKSDVYYQNERKIKGTLTNVDYDRFGMKIDIGKKITPKYSINAYTSYSKTQYKDIDGFYWNKREEDTYNFGLDNTYSLSNLYILKTGIMYSKNSSNQAPFNYHKYTFNLSVIRPF